MTVATQALSRLPEMMRTSLVANVGSLVSFRAGFDEATRLARELPGLGAADLQALRPFEVAARVSTGTGSGTVVMTGRTEPLPPMTGQAARIRAMSAERYGGLAEVSVPEGDVAGSSRWLRWAAGGARHDQTNRRPIASSWLSKTPRIRGLSDAEADGTPWAHPSVPPPAAARPRPLPPGLGQYDLAVMRFLSEVRLATGHQVARRLWASGAPTDAQARAARRCLARLEGAGVVQRLGRRMGGVRGGSTSIVYALGPAGRRLLIREGFVPRRLSDVGERYLAHALGITELIVRLAEADRDGTMEIIEVQPEPACWRGFLAGIGKRIVLKPDLFLRIGAGALEDRYFCEVDPASESAAAIRRKADRYVHYLAEGSEQSNHGVFPRVLFTAPNQHRLELLRGALGRVREAPEGLFSVWLFEEAVGRLASEASA